MRWASSLGIGAVFTAAGAIRSGAGHGFAEADGAGRLPVGWKVDGMFGKDDDGGAEGEAADFVALAESRGDFARGAPFVDVAVAAGVEGTVPDGFDAADDGGADEDERHQAVVGFEEADGAFVEGKEAGQGADGGGVDGVEAAGDEDGFAQQAVARDVDAVVVLGAEVEGGEAAVGEALGEDGVAAEQGPDGVVLPLGLQDAPGTDIATLAEGTIDGANQRGIGERACALAQRAGEKLVEGSVGSGVWLGGFIHVDTVAADEGADGGGGEAAAAAAGKCAGGAGEQVFGQAALQRERECVVHVLGIPLAGKGEIIRKVGRGGGRADVL